MSDQSQKAPANDEPVIDSYTPPLAKHKGLLALVITMGLMIIFGLVALGLTIMFMGVSSSENGASSTISEGAPALSSPVALEGVEVKNIDLPAGAMVQSTSVDGRRLYVHYTLGGENFILQYDLELEKTTNIYQIKQ